MRSYRVIGAQRETGEAVDEVLAATSVDDAERRANALGVMVSSVRAVEAEVVYTPARRRREQRAMVGRRWVRLIVEINAVLFLAPGALVLLGSIVVVIANLIDTAQRGGVGAVMDQLFGNAMGLFGWAVIALLVMLGGALLYLSLMAEQHLFEMNRRSRS